MEITGHSVEKLQDTTGILLGDRYEFHLDIEVPEDDELYQEKGLYLRVIFAVTQNESHIAQYQFYEKGTNEYIDFALEEDEKEIISNYCKQHIG
ncbi:DUF6509 family protein [Alkalihalobacillus sp. BA299]|uniref:DUF6509 family protein n=1 Tax=Alkalihalobacillus sp. BA299 TaxID=2815938 RepID=UPI001ADA0FB6|nr:DUF6509 family protein [Alkalihalobacillus sp. BA299]